MANLLDKANILITPTAYSDGKIHSAKPIQSLGSEVVSNGNFSNGSTDWTVNGFSNILVGDFKGKTSVAKINISNTGTTSRISQPFNYVSGKTYKVDIEVYVESGNFRADGSDTFVVGDFVTTSTLGSWQTLTANITAISTGSNFIWLRAFDSISEFYIANVSIKEVIDSDLNFTRGSAGTRVNAQGLIENVDTLGSEEVVNGDFATDSDWILENGAIINNGSVNIIGAGSRFKQDVLTVGKTYKLDYEVISTNGASFRFQDGVTAFVDINQTVGIHTYYFEATGVRTQFQAVGDINARIDNVSVKEVIDVTNIPRINYKDFQYEDSFGSDKVVNGNFATDTNWSKDSGWTISGGTANYDAVSSNQDLEQAITLIEGRVYAITFEIKSGEFRGRFLSLNSSIIENNNYTVGTHTVYGSVSAGSNLFVIKAVNTTGGSSFSIDNVSVKEVTKVVTPNSGVGSWLIEPQSTNLVTYSEDFNFWSKEATVILTDSYGTSPNGSINSTRVQLEQDDSIYISTTSGNTFSIYIKGVKGEKIRINNGDSLTHTLSGEWDRASIYNVSNNANLISINTYGGVSINARDIEIWGGQTEQQSFATSYIPTNGSVQTRLAETASRSGLGDLIDSTQGVFYAEISAFKSPVSSPLNITLSDGTANNYIRIELYQDGKVYGNVYDGSSVAESFTVNQENINKIALMFSENTCKLYLNGIGVGFNGKNFSSNTLNTFSFSSANGLNSFFYGNIKSLALFPILTDEELECLTTR